MWKKKLEKEKNLEIKNIFEGNKIVGFIPARGGSKSIKDKNIVPLAGYPLVAHSILALRAAGINEVFVSTNDSRIGHIAEQYGGIYFKRPPELARDGTSSDDVVYHFVSNKKCDIIVFVQATSPMVTPNEIMNGIHKFVKGNYESLFSAAVVDDMMFWNSSMQPLNYDPKNRQMRQKSDHTLIETGGFYIFRRHTFRKYKNRICGRVGYSPVNFWGSFEVDTEKDLNFIDKLMRKELI